MENIINYYRVLGVSYEATFNEIKEAYRTKVKEFHPDKKDGDAEHFKRIKEAYEILRSSEKRKQYDELLYKSFNRLTQRAKQTAPLNTNPQTTVIRIGKKNRKNFFLSSLTINAAILAIGLLIKKK